MGREKRPRESESVSGFGRIDSSRFFCPSFVVSNDVRLRGEVEEGSGFGKNKGNRGKRGVGLRVCCRAFSPLLCITWRGRR